MTEVKIAIDAFPLLSSLTGVGQYTNQLIKQFNLLAPENDYTYYYGYFTKKLLYGNEQTFRMKDALWKMPAIKYGIRRAKDTLSQLHTREFDLYFEPNFIPLNIRSKKLVTTVHDFSVRLFPEDHPKDRVSYFSQHFVTRVMRSSRVLTDSEYVKEEAKSLLGLPDEKVTSIHLGVNHETFRVYDKDSLQSFKREHGLPERFILFVGSREPRKNLEGLARAYRTLPKHLQDEFKLVLVGPGGRQDYPTIEKLGESVTDLGYIDADNLARLFNLASLFVFLSFYEGFGLPPLEAMACGCSAVVSKAASLPEVCGDAAYYVDPKDVDSIAEGMSRVLGDEALRGSLVAKGIERAKLFTWEETAKKTLDVFEEVMGMKD
jgi:glycosyltransferase involved in cell wall biosynthesis